MGKQIATHLGNVDVINRRAHLSILNLVKQIEVLYRS